MLKSYKWTRRAASIGFLLLLSNPVVAGDNYEVNGFVTQGYFYTDNNNFYGDSQNGSFDFRELGINGAWNLKDDLLLSGQAVSRLAGGVDDGDPVIDYLLLDYRFFEDQSGSAGISLGRNKNPFGLYNKTRDVSFTRPSIVLPQSLYFDKARNLELSSDGIRLYGRKFFESGVWDSELVAGIPRKDKNIEFAYLNRDWDGEFSSSKGYLFRTEYRPHDYSWVAGLNYGNFYFDFDGPDSPAPGAPGDGDVDIGILAFSLQYNLQHWSFTSEYMRQSISWGSLGGLYALQPKNVSESYYVQAERRINDQLSLFIRRDILYIDKNDRDGKRAEALSGRPAHSQYAFDWTLGVGWRPAKNWLVRAEWHRIEGTGWLAVQDNPVASDTEEDWNMLSLQATYRF